MKSKNLKSIGWGFVAGVLVVGFNNCAQKLNGPLDSGSMVSASTNVSVMPIVNDGSESQQTSIQGSQISSSSATAKSLIDAFSQVKLFTSNNPNGPFIENGAVCKGQASYFKMTGVNANMIIKGCASPSATDGCLDISKHRSYLASEWVSGNIVTVISAADSNNYPSGDYAFFISGAQGNTNIIQKVGSAHLKSCGATTESTQPVQKVCEFRILDPRAVIGGGSNIYPFACNEQKKGHIGPIRYDMGSGRGEDFSGICECK